MDELASKLASSELGEDLDLDLSGSIDLLEVKFDDHPLLPGHKFSKDQVKTNNRIKNNHFIVSGTTLSMFYKYFESRN
jgi:hypothetical protein